MRVLFVLSIGHFSGGAAVVWLNLMDGLRNRGIEPYVVMPSNKNDSLVTRLDEREIPHETVFFTWWTCGDGHPHSTAHRVRRIAARRVNAKADSRIAQLIDQWKIDLVYIADGTITAGLDAAQARNVPAVWHFHEVVTEDGAGGGQAYLDSAAEVSRQLARPACVLTVAEHIAQGLRARSPQADVRAVCNGVDASHVAGSSRPVTDDAVITLCGRIDANKRQEDAIEAFELVAEKFPQTRLQIVGTGDEELMQRLQGLAAEANLSERISFPGETTDMAKLWQETSIALNCSYNEGCSLVVMEALSSGCLVIGSSAPGNAELLADGHGLVYERCDARDLADKLLWALEHQRQAADIAATGKQWALEAFSLDRQLDQVAEAFAEALR